MTNIMEDNSRKIILDLCGGTGSWSKPYRDAGYDVRVITLPDSDVTDDKVIRECIELNPYGILAAPPCTEFAVSGARWWKDKDPQLLFNAVLVVHACLYIIKHTNPVFWALENPVGRLKKIVKELGEPNLTFNPCDYGDAYTKKTLVWGQFNLPIKNPIEPKFVTYKNGKRFAPNYGWSSNKGRSITPAGFAKAFFEANQ